MYDSTFSSKNSTARPAASIQTRLQVNQAGDKYEQEADRVADQVVNSVSTQQPAIQRKCAACEKEESVQKKPILQKMEEEEVRSKAQLTREEDIQTKKNSQSSESVSGDVQTKIEQSKGAGSPLSSSTRSFMESRIGADFSNVKIHNDSNAHILSTKLNAQAFAVGNNVFFNKGKYNPESQSGKHLLAHELTHTVQQGSSIQTMIQKQDSETDNQGYTFGRDPHHHVPGNWAEVQAIAQEKCDNEDGTVSFEQAFIECRCANNTPAQIMDFVLDYKMIGDARAQAHLRHYLEGSAEEYDENQNLRDLVLEDEKVNQWISYNIAQGLNNNIWEGHFMIEQGHYDEEDFQLAFGGIDRVDWQYDPDTTQVTIWFKDPYDFHPIYPGLYEVMGAGDHFPNGPRISNCVHAAAVELLKTDGDDTGAAIFIMRGKAIFNLNDFDVTAENPLKNGPGDISSDLMVGDQL